MKVRLRREDGSGMEYGRAVEIDGLPVVLRDAGHVFGSAMVRVGDVLYTGDLNPEGGLTCGRAEPEECEVLVTEATYGRSVFSFPPKEEVMNDLLSWTESCLEEGPVAVGAYEFGKSQELIALMNRAGHPVVVTDAIADLADVYRRHGLALSYRRLSEVDRRDLASSVVVVPRRLLRYGGSPEMAALRAVGGRAAFVSGWCSLFNFRRSLEIDAQFPLSDHADFDSLLDFVEACDPRKVYTCNGYTEELAREIRHRLRIPAEPVGHGWF
jgi:Cft2 family RNA processing exonuclease